MNCMLYTVKGRVQGVGFRWSTNSFAFKNKISGYVKNLDDGDVEILACGDSYQLGKLEEWLNSGGPAFAKVSKFTKKEINLKEYPTSFNIEV